MPDAFSAAYDRWLLQGCDAGFEPELDIEDEMMSVEVERD